MSDVVKETVVINGKIVVVPVFDETKHNVLGLRRKTRHLPKDQQAEEIIYLWLEKNLTDEELDVWDELTEEEVEEAYKAIEAEPLGKESSAS